MLDRSLAGPRSQDARGLASVRLSANECTENFAASVTCRCAVGHGVKDFYPVAGPDVEDLRYTECISQSGQACRYLGLGDRKTSYLIDADVSIGETHHANLVHGSRRPRGMAPCVIE
jgi:hypothetical protein